MKSQAVSCLRRRRRELQAKVTIYKIPVIKRLANRGMTLSFEAVDEEGKREEERKSVTAGIFETLPRSWMRRVLKGGFCGFRI